MALANTYTDALLAPKMTEAVEARAVADVADLGTLPASWVSRLQVLRAYVLLCLDKGTDADDAYAAKLAAYRKEWADCLAQARSAQAAGGASATGASFLTIGLERC